MLIAANLTANTCLNTDHPMYKQFMELIKTQEGSSSSQSYSTALTDDSNTNTTVFYKNTKEEVILLLNRSDSKWQNKSIELVHRYLDTTSYPTPAYKYQMHYEKILESMGSTEFNRFLNSGTTKAYSFSKMIIKKVLSPEEWV